MKTSKKVRKLILQRSNGVKIGRNKVSKRRVFITGEQGNLATSLEKRLECSEEFEIVWGSKNHIEELCHRDTRWGLELDILDRAEVGKALRRTEPDIIVHTAALVGTERCEAVTLNAYEVNTLGTFNVVKEAFESGVPDLVYFSTTATYKPDSGVLREYGDQDPATVYGQTKYYGQMISECYFDEPLTILPCFVYGGKRDFTVSAISKLIRNGLLVESGPKDPSLLPILDIYLDPKRYKDYMYIQDFIEAVYLLMKGKIRGMINVSNQMPIRFQKVLDEIEKYVKPRYQLYPEKDYLGNHIVDNSLLMSVTDWEPRISLAEGIQRVYEEDARCL